MALPTLSKTWQFNVNIEAPALGPGGYYSDVTYSARRILLAFKNALIGFSSSPWTVWGSSNSSSYSNSGTDYWTSEGSLVWHYNSHHSWIVLKQTGLGSNACLCLDLFNEYYGRTAYIIYMPNGPNVNGDTLQRPTGTYEIVLNGPDTRLYWFGSSGDKSGRWHIMQSTDGECLRWVCTCPAWNTPYGPMVGSYYFLEKVKNPPTSWTTPVICGGVTSGGGGPGDYLSYYYFNRPNASGVPNPRTRGWLDNKLTYFTCPSEGWGASPLGEQITFADDDTGEWPFSPAGLVSYGNWSATSYTNNGRRGIKGQLYDAWWGSTDRQTGESYPDDNSNQFVQFGDMIFPWDGSFPILT